MNSTAEFGVASPQSWAQVLAVYREPNPVRSFFEIGVTLLPLAGLWALSWAAIYFGRRILRIANSTEFLWFMSGFIAFCLIGSVISIIQWVRVGKSKVEAPEAAS